MSIKRLGCATLGCRTILGTWRGNALVLGPGVVVEVRPDGTALRCPSCGGRRPVARLTIVSAAA